MQIPICFRRLNAIGELPAVPSVHIVNYFQLIFEDLADWAKDGTLQRDLTPIKASLINRHFRLGQQLCVLKLGEMFVEGWSRYQVLIFRWINIGKSRIPT